MSILPLKIIKARFFEVKKKKKDFLRYFDLYGW